MSKNSATVVQIIRRASLCDQTGLSAASINRLVKRGEFPAPIAIGPRRIGWKVSDVNEWISKRPVAHLPPAVPTRKAKA